MVDFVEHGVFRNLEVHGAEAHHLTAKLCKSAVAVHDSQVAVFIYVALVAGLVPAFAVDDGYGLGGAFRVLQVPLHNLGATDENQSVATDGQLFHGVRVHNAELGSRQRRAHGTRLVALQHRLVVVHQNILGVYRRHGGGLGTAKAFENFQLELGAVKLSHVFANLFGSGVDAPHMAKHQRVHRTVHAPHPQEGARGHHDGHLELGAHTGHKPCIRRVGASSHRHTVHQAKHSRNGEPEGMEQRERPQEHIVGAGVQHTFALLDVTHQVEVGQFHSLGATFGTGTENNGRHVVQGNLLEEPKFQIPGRKQHHPQEVQHQGGLFQLFLQVFHVIDLVLVQKLLHGESLLLQLVDKHPGGNDGLHVGHVTAVVHGLRRVGVVQVIDRLALDEAGHVHDDTRARRRNQHAHVLFALGKTVNHLGKSQGRRRQGVCRQVVAVGTIDRRSAPDTLDRAYPGRSHRTEQPDIRGPRRNGKFLHGPLDRNRIRIQGKFFAKGYGDDTAFAMD